MQCPVCPSTALVLSERQGIEIDYCPQCRGVWLDRGELDKLIERSAAAAPAPVAAPVHAPVPAPQRSERRPDYQDSGYPPPHGHYRKKKREGFLSDLFDF